MAQEAELVGEFRGIVDWLFERQAKDNKKHRPFGIHCASLNPHIVKAAGLAFTAQVGVADIARTAGEAGVVDMATKYPFCANDERLWEVGHQAPDYVGKHPARLAIASFASCPDQLIRTWALARRKETFQPIIQRNLTTAVELEDVLAWVKAPHLAGDSYDRISAVGPEELDIIEQQLAEGQYSTTLPEQFGIRQ